ncbi:hypothetical protein GH733_002824 [Mirounga leonina]|nr:hypothetical protein GH733_002824 [Mirounga leonina]
MGADDKDKKAHPKLHQTNDLCIKKRKLDSWLNTLQNQQGNGFQGPRKADIYCGKREGQRTDPSSGRKEKELFFCIRKVVLPSRPFSLCKREFPSTFGPVAKGKTQRSPSSEPKQGGNPPTHQPI